jgi:hypothetical protein
MGRWSCYMASRILVDGGTGPCCTRRVSSDRGGPARLQRQPQAASNLVGWNTSRWWLPTQDPDLHILLLSRLCAVGCVRRPAHGRAACWAQSTRRSEGRSVEPK